MRRILKIIFFIVLVIYFLPLLIPIKAIANSFWHPIICSMFMIPYSIYESIQLIKDDKANNTHVFRNRILMVLGVLIVLYLFNLYMSKYYS